MAEGRRAPITLPCPRHRSLARSALKKHKGFCNYRPVSAGRSRVAMPAGQRCFLPLPKHLFCLIKHTERVLSCWGGVQGSPPRPHGRAEWQR